MPHHFRHLFFILLMFIRRFEGQLVTGDHLLNNMRGRDAGQIRTPCRHRQRKRQADQVVCGVADDGLVEVADLDGERAIGAGDGAEIADMAIAANPDGRPIGDGDAVRRIEPFIEADCAAADIGVSGRGHFQVARFGEPLDAVLGHWDFGHARGHAWKFSLFPA